MKRILTITAGSLAAVALITAIVFAVLGAEHEHTKQVSLAATPAVGATQVEMNGFIFAPARIKVAVGTTITWTNVDDAPHSVTFDGGLKDSGVFQRGGTFSYTFTTPGSYTYHCSVHPYMVGEVIVTN